MGSSLPPPSPFRSRLPRIARAALVIAAACRLLAGPPASAASLEERLAEAERTVRRLPRSSWTVQLALVCKGFNVEEALDSDDLASPRFALPITYRDTPCYRIFAGSFGTQKEALRAAASAPSRYPGAIAVRVGPLVPKGAAAAPEASPLPPPATPIPVRAPAVEREVPPEPEPVLPLRRPTPVPVTPTRPPA